MPPPYPREFRDRVLARVAEPGASVDGVAREFEISRNTISNWRKQDDAGSPSDEGEPNEELRRLRRRVKQLDEEKEILRKATAFFAAEERRRR